MNRHIPLLCASQLAAVVLLASACGAFAQQPPPQQVQQPQAQQPPAQQPQVQQQGSQWAKLPRMQLERQFAGPLQDTIIQRWRDPVDGTVCYIYLPITAAHTAPMPNGFVEYGANTIGTVSCLAPPAAEAASAQRKPPAH